MEWLFAISVLLCIITFGVSVCYLRILALHGSLAEFRKFMASEAFNLEGKIASLKDEVKCINSNSMQLNAGLKQFLNTSSDDKKPIHPMMCQLEDELHDLKLNVNTQIQNQNVAIAGIHKSIEDQNTKPSMEYLEEFSSQIASLQEDFENHKSDYMGLLSDLDHTIELVKEIKKKPSVKKASPKK